VVIGHDWGAAIVYTALGREPGRWACAVAASVPPTGDDPLDSFNLAQLRRSWYSFLFQLPDIEVPERLVAADDMELIELLWSDWSPGFRAPEDVAHAKDALRLAGHLRAAISYYREAPTRAREPGADAARQGAISGWQVPVLYLHGARDGCIGIDVVEGVRPRLAPTIRVAVLENAGHFLPLERPAEINDLVLGFLAEHA
jgi:pimeloyl-ACP methyl ester carboxylesterase